VVAVARERFGVEAVILRLLRAELPSPPGGEVTYLAQVDAPPPATLTLAPYDEPLADHPLRNAYARPGGPAADLAWAQARLAERGLRLAGPPAQIRTWNLSSLWRLPCDGGAAWLKVVPPFFAHEGALLARLAGERAPQLLARDGGRMLLAEIAGDDLYEAAQAQLPAMIDLLVDLQHRWAGRAGELLALGAPDWRAGPVAEAVIALVDRLAPTLGPEDRRTLDRFAHGLPRRLEALEACGLPDTLVHGDFHPGNLRGAGLDLTLLDWGDSGLGHPLLDQSAFLQRVPADLRAAMAAHWTRRWREAARGCDPARAAALLAPLAAARRAVVYQRFLDQIEPDEHPYHRGDPQTWLAATAAIVRTRGAAA